MKSGSKSLWPYGQPEANESHPGTSASWVPRAVTSADARSGQAGRGTAETLALWGRVQPSHLLGGRKRSLFQEALSQVL